MRLPLGLTVLCGQRCIQGGVGIVRGEDPLHTCKYGIHIHPILFSRRQCLPPVIPSSLLGADRAAQINSTPSRQSRPWVSWGHLDIRHRDPTLPRHSPTLLDRWHHLLQLMTGGISPGGGGRFDLLQNPWIRKQTGNIWSSLLEDAV